MGERDLLASMTMDQNFPGKETHCGPFFYISIAQWSVEKDDTIMGKVAKGKGKTRGKNGKTTNRQTVFKITIQWGCQCFSIKARTCNK